MEYIFTILFPATCYVLWAVISTLCCGVGVVVWVLCGGVVRPTRCFCGEVLGGNGDFAMTDACGCPGGAPLTALNVHLAGWL